MSQRDDVTSAMSASDPEERRRAVVRIAELPASQRVQLLLMALGDEDWRVRKEAIGLTADLGPEPELLAALAGVFAPGDNVGLRNAAVEALGAFGIFAVETLSPRISKLDADGKKLSIETLGRSGEAAALDALATLVNDPDANVRVAALEAIGAVAAARVDEARDLLMGRLDPDKPLETLAALESLALIGAGLPFATVEPWLRDRLLGRAALALAAQSGDPKAAEPLVAYLLSGTEPGSICALSDYVVASEPARRAALEELTKAGEAGEGALLRWLSHREGDVECARAALLVVGSLGVAAGAELAVDWLSDARCYSEADQALFQLGPLAIPALQRGARSLESETAAACLDLIGRLPPDAVGAEERHILTAALSSSSADVVRAALGALTRVGDADCLTELVRLLDDEGLVSLIEPALGAVSQRHPQRALSFVQLSALEGSLAHAAALVIAALAARGRLGSIELGELTAFLVRLLSSTSHTQRRAALAALAELGSGDALDAVRFALADEEPAVRAEAVRTLGRLKGRDTSSVGVPALLEVVSEAHDSELVLAALRALGESSDGRALGVLGPLVRSTDARVAVTAVEALARHADARRLSLLFDGLHHTEPEVVKAAMLAIAAEPDPRALVHLGACLDQPAWDVRRLAADLLGRAPSDASASLLRARLSVEQDPMVKDALTRALEHSGQRRSRPPRRPQGEP
ncbi:MAG TPA: HEAT repeat domain-containing protein [Polyangiaceae bacterium]|nr:HEAT repeat domain-containing protein [Polyangiaceae bacterium]